MPEDMGKLVPHATVVPHCGDVLIFPHGNMNGCHPNPLHEGSTVLSGEKCLIRTDLVYKAAPTKKKQARKQKKQAKDEKSGGGVGGEGGGTESAHT